MANVLNEFSRLYTFNIADIIKSGPITVSKIVFRPEAETNTAVLHTCDLSATPDCDAGIAAADITSTATITDSGSGGPFDGAAAGDWLYISDCDTVADDGWYYIKTYTNTNVIVVENGTNPLTNATAISMHIKVYSPEEAMLFVAEDSGVTVNQEKDELDWGNRGRFRRKNS